MQTKNFIGLDGFVWWLGVVENRIDPLNLGRCQVRIFGWHSDSEVLIPTADLPWAIPMLPINSTQVITLKEGDMVAGFFTDGASGQQPVVMGLIPGIPNKLPPVTDGFTDKRSVAALKASPRKVKTRKYNTDGTGISIQNDTAKRNPENLNEPTTSRLARNENTAKTILQDRVVNLDKNVPIAGDKGYWSEPAPSYGAKFPFNKAVETESGHSFEIDDTPGAERINTTHRSGTFFEIYPSGSKVEKITKSNYQIIMADDNIHVMGKVNITIDSDARILVRGDVNLDVGNNLTARVAKNINVIAGESFNLKAKKINIQSVEDMQTVVGTKSLLAVASTMDVSAGGNININTNTKMTTTAGSKYEVMAGGTIEMTAGSIKLNPGTLLSVITQLATAAYTSGMFPGFNAAIDNAFKSVTSTLTSTASTFTESMSSALSSQATGAGTIISSGAVSPGFAGGTFSFGLSGPSAFDLSAAGNWTSASVVSAGSGNMAISLGSTYVTDTAGQTILGNVIGGSVAGATLPLSITAVESALTTSTGSLFSKGFVETLKDTITVKQLVGSLPALVTNPAGALLGLAGTSAGNLVGTAVSNSGLSIGSFVDTDKLVKIANAATKSIVASGGNMAGATSIFVGETSSIISSEIQKGIQTAADAVKPTLNSILSNKTSGPGIVITEGQAFGGTFDDMGNFTKASTTMASSTPSFGLTTDQLFGSTDDFIAGVYTPPVVASTDGIKLNPDAIKVSLNTSVADNFLDKAITEIIDSRVISKELDKVAQDTLDKYLSSVKVRDLVSNSLYSMMPKTVGDAVNFSAYNPAVMMGSLVSSQAFQTTSVLQNSLNTAISGAKDVISKITPTGSVLAVASSNAVFTAANTAVAYGLTDSFTSMVKNNAIATLESSGISSGIFNTVDNINNSITTVASTIEQNITDLQNKVNAIATVPGPTYKEEMLALVDECKVENQNLLDNLNASIAINVDIINNTTVFVIDPVA